jgi:hypothetical protein
VSVWKVGGKSGLTEGWMAGLPIFHFLGEGLRMDDIRQRGGSTPDREQEVKRIKERLRVAFEEDIEQIARLMTSKSDEELFGRTEFELRDITHQMGAKALEMAANERIKKGLPGS